MNISICDVKVEGNSLVMCSWGHPAKYDCSTEVLLYFCTRATFLPIVRGAAAHDTDVETMAANLVTFIREENLLQMVLWKTVHFALFLVKISINFSPGYSTVFFFITVYVSTLQ
jgi:hypothetical protein